MFFSFATATFTAQTKDYHSHFFLDDEPYDFCKLAERHSRGSQWGYFQFKMGEG
jgi:hypothetical protein